MSARITVIGAGSWGSAIARHLSQLGNEVAMWSHSQSVARDIENTHMNSRYLPGCYLGDTISVSTSLMTAIQDACACVFVVPSNHLRSVCFDVAQYIDDSMPVIVLTKGIEPSTNMLMTEVVASEISKPDRIACLSGPNHAEEVARDLPSAAVVAAQNDAITQQFQSIFNSDTFRTYVSNDVIGVEVCAAYKNVVAVACGILKGYGYGDNTSALIMTRGLAEMSRLVVARGGDPFTCMGLAGMGDLIATCTSRHSRNATFGQAFANGETLKEFTERTHMVVEGALACMSIRELAHTCNVEVPIADAVYSVLYEGMSFDQAKASLFARAAHVEFYGINE